MAIQVRLATLEDVEDITAVHCSNVEEWFRWEGGQKAPVHYEDLAIYQRWRNGGPWMSVETCAVRINHLLLAGHYPLVAEIGGRVLGEAELFLSEEPPPLGRYLNLSVLYVHRDQQRQGIGSALMEAALSLGRELGCDALTINGTPEAPGFYARFGFRSLLHLQKAWALCRDYGQPCRAETFWETSYETVEGLTMAIGRYQSAREEWERAGIDTLALSEIRGRKSARWKLWAGEGRAYAILAQTYFDPTVTDAYAWIETLPLPLVIKAILSQGKSMGFAKVNLLLEESTYYELADEFALVPLDGWEMQFHPLSGER